jgi:hypothetical protein
MLQVRGSCALGLNVEDRSLVSRAHAFIHKNVAEAFVPRPLASDVAWLSVGPEQHHFACSTAIEVLGVGRRTWIGSAIYAGSK